MAEDVATRGSEGLSRLSIIIALARVCPLQVHNAIVGDGIPQLSSHIFGKESSSDTSNGHERSDTDAARWLLVYAPKSDTPRWRG